MGFFPEQSTMIRIISYPQAIGKIAVNKY